MLAIILRINEFEDNNQHKNQTDDRQRKIK